METDLKNYFRRNSLYSAVFDIQLSKSDEEAAAETVSELDGDVVLADLLAAMNRVDEAKAAYLKLSKAGAGKPEVEQSLGYLAWRSHDRDEARARFARAFELGTKDPLMCYHYAMLEREKGKEGRAVVPILERALQLKPDYLEARIELGNAKMTSGDYPGAIADLSKITKIDPEKAPRLFSSLAYAYARGGNTEAARQNAELAQKWAKSPEDKNRAAEMLRYLDSRKKADTEAAAMPRLARPAERSVDAEGRPRIARREAPAATWTVRDPKADRNPFVALGEDVARLEGVAKMLECKGESARFHMTAGGKTLVFSIPDPGRVLIKHLGAATFDFSCGAQKPFAVVVEYSPDAAGKTAGIVKSLEF